MTNVKIGFAFVLGWFCCGLLTPRLLSNTVLDHSVMLQPRATLNTSGVTAAKCDDESSEDPLLQTQNGSSSLVRLSSIAQSALVPGNKAASAGLALGGEESGGGGNTVAVDEPPPKISSRCEFVWDAAARCKRPPFKVVNRRRRRRKCLSMLLLLLLTGQFAFLALLFVSFRCQIVDCCSAFLFSVHCG